MPLALGVYTVYTYESPKVPMKKWLLSMAYNALVLIMDYFWFLVTILQSLTM